jgi:protoporphyrinogen/coproporphyrinogen III oxidase
MNTKDTLIIGAGISGLTIAHTLRTRCYGHKFLLLDKEERAGGAIRTHSEEGFVTETGPHGFLNNCEESKVLLADIGLNSECLHAPLSRFVRYVYVSGALRQIPQTPPSILMAPLISWKDKFRVLADLWKKPLPGEPTVARWAAYRFGPALLPFIDAVFTGTYAGDMDKLTIDGVMQGIRALEKQHGSVIRGLLAGRRKKTGPRRLSLPAMTSFSGGMQRLPDRLVEFLRPEVDLLLNCEVEKIRKIEGEWQVESAKGNFSAPNLVLALPVNASLALLKEINNRMPLQHIPEAWIANVVLAFDKDVKLPPGFGFLIPETEGRFSLGALFSSNMFPGRAPAGCSLVEVLVGGRRHPERAELDDQALIRQALEDIRDILDIAHKPIFTKVLRNSCGIPQPELGYPELLAWRDRLVNEQRGLSVCGFGWEGIGINDMIKTAGRVAENIMADRTNNGPKTAVKGVYF